MKNLILSLGVAIVAVVSFSSCAKDSCYTCTNDIAGTTHTVDICGDSYTTSYDNGTTDTSYTTSLSSGVSVDDYKASLEAGGYSCSEK